MSTPDLKVRQPISSLGFSEGEPTKKRDAFDAPLEVLSNEDLYHLGLTKPSNWLFADPVLDSHYMTPTQTMHYY